jgi:hypothetical protein
MILQCGSSNIILYTDYDLEGSVEKKKSVVVSLKGLDAKMN